MVCRWPLNSKTSPELNLWIIICEFLFFIFYPVSMHFSREPPGHWPPRLVCLRWLLPLPFPVLLLRWAAARGLAAAPDEAGTRFWLRFLLEFLRALRGVATLLEEELFDCEMGLFLGGLLLINPWASSSPCKNDILHRTLWGEGQRINVFVRRI